MPPRWLVIVVAVWLVAGVTLDVILQVMLH
jgi:hypothetical protein